MLKHGLLALGRRKLLNAGMQMTLSLGRQIGSDGAGILGSSVTGLAAWMPHLRRRLRFNYSAAGLEATSAQVDGYFRRLRCWAGWSAAVYARGFVDSGIAARITLDDSFARIEDAVAKGKGVILACPHAFCCDLAAAAVNLRHPVVGLVRESKSAAREAIKAHWFRATGMSVLKRPRRASILADTMSAIRTLRSGSILGITPDVIQPAHKGVAVEMLGRSVHLSPGIIMLSMRVGSPVIMPWGVWVPGRTARHDRLVLSFRTLEFCRGKQTDADARDGLQQWCRVYEDHVRRNPDYWMFWLDKNWNKVFSAKAA